MASWYGRRSAGHAAAAVEWSNAGFLEGRAHFHKSDQVEHDGRRPPQHGRLRDEPAHPGPAPESRQERGACSSPPAVGPLDPVLTFCCSGSALQVSLSAFSFLFSEMVQYFQGRVQNISDLENRLDGAGFGVGVRVVELLCHREKSGRRETRLLNMLQFVVSTCWKALFGKAADALERSTENEDEYMIHELEPLTNKFVSVPPDLGQLDCAAYIAGIVRGILCSSGFLAQVTAHTVEVPGGQRDKTVFLVKFDESVIRRERALT